MNKIILSILLLWPALGRAQGFYNTGVLSESGSTCTVGSCITLILVGNAGAVTIGLAGTFSATVQFEGTNDNQNWAALSCFPLNSGSGASSATSTGTWSCNASALISIRARVSSYTSGRIAATLNSSTATSVRTVLPPTTVTPASTGVDMFDKINKATALLTVFGGVIDATAFSGSQLITTTLALPQNVEVLLGGVLMKYCGTGYAIDILSPAGATVFTEVVHTAIVGIAPIATTLEVTPGCSSTPTAMIHYKWSTHNYLARMTIVKTGATYGLYQEQDLDNRIDDVTVYDANTTAGTIGWYCLGCNYDRKNSFRTIGSEYGMVFATTTQTVDPTVATLLQYVTNDGNFVYHNNGWDLQAVAAGKSNMLWTCNGSAQNIQENDWSFARTQFAGSNNADDDDDNGISLACAAPVTTESIILNHISIASSTNRQHDLFLQGAVYNNRIEINSVGSGASVTNKAYAIYLKAGTGVSPLSNIIVGSPLNSFAVAANRAYFLAAGSARNALQVVIGAHTGTDNGTQNQVQISDNVSVNYPTVFNLGEAGAYTGTLTFGGATSGTITVKPQAVAGTWEWDWPTTAGSASNCLASQGGAGVAMTWIACITGASPTITTPNITKIQDGNGNNNILSSATTSAVNGLVIGNGATNSAVSLSPGGSGSDSNIGLIVAGKGTGVVSITSIASMTANRVALTADWTCGTGGTVSSCTAATIIGSGGGVPLTFTLPPVALSWHWSCEGVVGQATAATLNSWNFLTATNGASNVTSWYSMNTGATAMTGGATTDTASTTTTVVIGPTWTLGGIGTKMPFQVGGTIEGASASGTVLSLQLVAPTVADLVTIYRGAECTIGL